MYLANEFYRLVRPACNFFISIYWPGLNFSIFKVYLPAMKKTLLPAIILFACLGASAQKTSKKPLDQSVYDGWQSINNQLISNDGKSISYM
jgi:hypothetical protein